MFDDFGKREDAADNAEEERNDAAATPCSPVLRARLPTAFHRRFDFSRRYIRRHVCAARPSEAATAS